MSRPLLALLYITLWRNDYIALETVKSWTQALPPNRSPSPANSSCARAVSTISGLDHALAQVMSSSIDSADLYFQLSREESWALEDGIVKEGSASIEQGVGVRAVAGEKTGFAYSDEIVLPALEEASRAARAIAVRGGDRAAHSVLPTQRPQPLSTHRSGEQLHLERKGRVARARRSRDPQDGSARQAGDGERGRRARSGAGRQQRGTPRRRRAAAGALQRLRHRRAGRAARAGLRGRRRAHHAARAGGGRQTAGARARSRAPGAGESRRGARARGPHDRRARFRLAGHPAARGHRPRTRRRLQSQGHLGVRRPRRRTRGVGAVHDRRRRHAVAPPRLAQHRRRGHAHAVHHADRERRAQGLSAGQDERAAHGHGVHGQRPARVVRAHHAAAHDQHLHASPARRRPKKSSRRCRRASTP